MLDDDLRIRVDTFDLADESHRLARVAVRIVGIANDKGELGNDAELMGSPCDFQRLLCGDPFLHLFEHPVRTGLRSEEDHRASCSFDCGECFIRIPGHDVDTRFAPPAKIQMRHAIAELPRVILAQEKVHIVELNRVCAVAFNQMSQNGDRSLGRLHLLLVAIRCVNTAEAAVERTADARMMNGRALPEEGRT